MMRGMGMSVYPPVSPVPPEPDPEVRTGAACRQDAIRKLDPFAADLIADISGFDPNHPEHNQA